MSFFTIFDILNNSKYFSGFIMILMNLGSKYVSMELSEVQEEFLSRKLIRRILVFAIFFMATRDVLVSIILTGIFILFIGSLLNDNSKFCLIKKKNPKTKIIDKEDVEKAKKIIKKYEKQQMMRNNK
jgi:hypothetical protein|tara:strand:- start:130 stop:510 length:381 start_codon:yes stop_codon:yes gene_type:complete